MFSFSTHASASGAHATGGGGARQMRRKPQPGLGERGCVGGVCADAGGAPAVDAASCWSGARPTEAGGGLESSSSITGDLTRFSLARIAVMSSLSAGSAGGAAAGRAAADFSFTLRSASSETAKPPSCAPAGRFGPTDSPLRSAAAPPASSSAESAIASACAGPGRPATRLGVGIGGGGGGGGGGAGAPPARGGGGGAVAASVWHAASRVGARARAN